MPKNENVPWVLEVPLPDDIDCEGFGVMLHYIYTEETAGLCWYNVFEVLKAGKKFLRIFKVGFT